MERSAGSPINTARPAVSEELGRGGSRPAALHDHILILKVDYFSNMNLPELPCWQAMALKRTGRAPQAQEMILAHPHTRFEENAAFARAAGYCKTTPLFISYGGRVRPQAPGRMRPAVRHGLAGAAGDRQTAASVPAALSFDRRAASL
ncbi:MAG: hypothetical protein ACLUE8_18100 [Lachnospiraceae bacterium]